MPPQLPDEEGLPPIDDCVGFSLRNDGQTLICISNYMKNGTENTAVSYIATNGEYTHLHPVLDCWNIYYDIAVSQQFSSVIIFTKPSAHVEFCRAYSLLSLS